MAADALQDVPARIVTPPDATGMPSRSAASRKRAWWPLM